MAAANPGPLVVARCETPGAVFFLTRGEPGDHNRPQAEGGGSISQSASGVMRLPVEIRSLGSSIFSDLSERVTMKVLAVLLVVVIAVVAAVLKFGGATGFDPAATVDTFFQEVKPGVTWQQVVDFKEPKRFHRFRDDGSMGSEVKFKKDSFTSSYATAFPDNGLMFFYAFDAKNQYEVYFDGSGTVTRVEKAMTFSDLVN